MRRFIALFIVLFAASTTVSAGTLSLEYARSSGLGFDQGVAIAADHEFDVGPLTLYGSANVSNELKMGAEQGYRYSTRGLVYVGAGRFDFGVGYGISGYESTFADSRVWKKQGQSLLGSVAYTGDRYGLRLIVSGPDGSENDARSATLQTLFKRGVMNFSTSVGVVQFDEGRTGVRMATGVGLSF